MLTCPTCGSRLTRASARKGVYFGCGECRGRMVATGVLRKEHTDAQLLREVWNRARTGTDFSGRLCPHCQRPMAQVHVPVGGHECELDVCTRCACIWFDRGEYKGLPHGASPEPREAPLSPEAREAIARAKVKHIQDRAEADTGAGPDERWKYVPAMFGLPVECDVPRVSRWPVVTWGLGIALVGVLAATWGSLESVVQDWGFIPAQWSRHGGMTLLTSILLHGGLAHLIGNLYFLLVFGDNVEDDLGRWRYAWLLLLAGLAGSVMHGLFDPRASVPCVGASASISGVIVYYATAFPHARLGFFFRWGFLYRWVRVPAYAALVLWLALQALIAHSQASGVGHVSGLAHLGGAGVGLVMAIGFRHRSQALLAGGTAGDP